MKKVLLLGDRIGLLEWWRHEALSRVDTGTVYIVSTVLVATRGHGGVGLIGHGAGQLSVSPAVCLLTYLSPLTASCNIHICS